MEYVSCPKCKKNLFDDADQYCLDCDYGIKGRIVKEEGEWDSWIEVHHSGVNLYLESDEDDKIVDESKEVFVNIKSQLGTTHITEAGFDRKLYPTGRVPLNEFLEICEERFAGRIPGSRLDLIKALGMLKEGGNPSKKTVEEMVRKRELKRGKMRKLLPVACVGTAWFWSPMAVRVAYVVRRNIRIEKMKGEWDRPIDPERDLGPEDFL